MNDIIKGLFLILVIVAAFTLFAAYIAADISYELGYNDAVEESFNPDTHGNYMKMRDLFTPCSWNDTVTISFAGEYWEGFNCTSNTFWVNHSNVCDSFYFDDFCCYRVGVPTMVDEDIFIIDYR